MVNKSDEEKHWQRIRDAYKHYHKDLERDTWPNKTKGKKNLFGHMGNIFGIFLGLATLGLYFTTVATLSMATEEETKPKSTQRPGTEYLAYNPSESDFIDSDNDINYTDKDNN